MIDVDYYKSDDGYDSIDPYLDGLDPKMRAKVLRATLTNGFTKNQQKTHPGELKLEKNAALITKGDIKNE